MPDLTTTRDRDLIERIAVGDEAAFRQLFSTYAGMANALATRILRQPVLADEVVQEVFLSVWQSSATYDRSKGSVRAWLMTQVHHRAVDVVRKEETERRHAVAVATRDVPPPDGDPGEIVPAAVDLPAERAAARSALAGLSEDQRQVLELMYFEGLSQSQVAARIDAPLGTVKSRAAMGMRYMKEAIGAWAP